MTNKRCRKCGATEDLALLAKPRSGPVEFECRDDVACLRRQRCELGDDW